VLYLNKSTQESFHPDSSPSDGIGSGLVIRAESHLIRPEHVHRFEQTISGRGRDRPSRGIHFHTKPRFALDLRNATAGTAGKGIIYPAAGLVLAKVLVETVCYGALLFGAALIREGSRPRPFIGNARLLKPSHLLLTLLLRPVALVVLGVPRGQLRRIGRLIGLPIASIGPFGLVKEPWRKPDFRLRCHGRSDRRRNIHGASFWAATGAAGGVAAAGCFSSPSRAVTAGCTPGNMFASASDGRGRWSSSSE
jgi:hypothetical protein